MTENALKGLHTGGTGALGYNVDPDTKKYTINEKESEAVRMIFRMYIEGDGYGVIADALNAQGYMTKAGKPFSKGSISSILRNERYTGVYIFNRMSSKNIDGKRNSHLYKTEDEMVRIEGGMPQIISKEDYQLALKKMESRKKVRACNNAKEVYLLSRKVICGECGRVYTGNRKNSGRKKTLHVTYACTGRKSRNGCENKEIRREYLETFVMEKLAEYLFDETLIPKICAAYDEYQMSKNAGHIKTKANYDKKIKEVTKSIDNIVEIIMVSPSPALAKKLSELEQEKERLNESYQELCKNTNIKQLNEEEITKMFRLARNQLEVGTLKMTKVLVETFIDKVLVYKDKVEVVFNFCKDISITQEIEDIVSTIKLPRGCENAFYQGIDAILCDGGESSLGMPTVNWTV
jgi:site-specific DNA recombinase